MFEGLICCFDEEGHDRFSWGSRHVSYRTSGGVKSASQGGGGLGFGGMASGGVCMLIDKQRKDYFTVGNFSQGARYFYGLGVLFNLGEGPDVYTASRYGQGASAHSVIGVFIDEGGDDGYFRTSICLTRFCMGFRECVFLWINMETIATIIELPHILKVLWPTMDFHCFLICRGKISI